MILAWDALFAGSVLSSTVNKWMNLLKLNYLLKIREDKELSFEASQKYHEFINKNKNILDEELQHYYDLISDTPDIAQKAFLEFYKNLPFTKMGNEFQHGTP